VQPLPPRPFPPPDPEPLNPPLVPAAVRYPKMPQHLQAEYDYLNETLARFDIRYHRARLSAPLRDWLDKQAA
jgi:hypothetical protein